MIKMAAYTICLDCCADFRRMTVDAYTVSGRVKNFKRRRKNPSWLPSIIIMDREGVCPFCYCLRTFAAIYNLDLDEIYHYLDED